MNKSIQTSKSSSARLKVRPGPAGLHFFNRATGINVLIDEVIPPANTWAAVPRHVSIALTNACDLACSHCFSPKKHATLGLDKLVAWLDELDANGCIGVGFGGGEPTLYPRLTELCFHAENNTSLALSMTTHAHRLNDQLLDELAETLHFIRVSMDGVGSTYETIRQRSFGALLERIAAIRRVARFGINFLVNSQTFCDLDAAVRLATDLGAAEFLLLPEEPVRGIGGIDKETATALREWVIGYRGQVPLAVSEDCSKGFPICNPLQAEKGLSAFAHIDASSILKRSSYDESGIYIRETGIITALNELKMVKEEVI